MSDERTTRTPEKEGKFLDALRSFPNVSSACRKARIARRTVYQWREADAVFAVAWDDALAEGVDALESEALRRAQKGTLEPVFYQGEKVGSVRRYSDTLIIFLLKAHNPSRFTEMKKTELTGADGAPLQLQWVGGLTERFDGDDGDE